MYRIVIIDDERYICEGLAHIIKRLQKPYVTDVKWFTSPFEAVRHIVNNGTEVVITDIKMPDKDGLHVMSDLSQLNPNIAFVVLSGYDDFEYVRKAFKNGVKDYLKKPVSTTRLSEVLDSIYKDISSMVSKTRIDNSKAIIENLLNKMFLNGSMMLISTQFEKLVSPYFDKQYFAVIVLRLSGLYDEDNIKCYFDWLGTDKNSFSHFYTLDHKNNLVELINFENESKYQLIMKKIMRTVNEISMENPEITVKAAASNALSGLANIRILYKNAYEALGYYPLVNDVNLISYQSIKMRNDQGSRQSKALQELKTLMASEDKKESAKIIVSKTFTSDNLSNCPIEVVNMLFLTAVNLIISIVVETDFDLSCIVDKDLSNFATLNELVLFLHELIERVHSKLSQSRVLNNTINIAIKYINDNYDKDINLAVVSNHVSVSYSYFSKQFHEKVGMNFKDYLQEVRMKAAYKMMHNPSNKIYEVASAVGYSSPKHFSRVFKDYYGKSPRMLRNDYDLDSDDLEDDDISQFS